MTTNIAVSLPLDRYLTSIGSSLNIYFTLEIDNRGVRSGISKQKNPSHFSPLFGAVVSEETKISNVSVLMDKLHRQFPSIAIVRDKKITSIFHIMDRSLQKDANYILNQDVNISYSGQLQNLPDALGKMLDNKITTRRVFTASHFSRDAITNVTVTANRLSVRDVLTDYVPIKTYSHLLWSAEAIQQSNGETSTNVAYFGPMT